MKYIKIVLNVSLLVLLFSNNSILAQDKRRYAIYGVFDSLPDQTKVYLLTQNLDTVQVSYSKGSKITFNGRLDPDGQFHFIAFDTALTQRISNAIFVSNTLIKVHGKIGKKDVVVTGSPAHQDFVEAMAIAQVYSDSMTQTMRAKSTVDFKISQLLKGGADSNEIQRLTIKSDGLSKEITQLTERFNHVITDWIRSHIHSLYAPYAIERAILHSGQGTVKAKEDLDNAMDLYGKLGKVVRQSYYGQQLQKAIANTKDILKVSEGYILPNIPLYNSIGESVFLYDIIKDHKINLIDCWASWCAPCRAQIPRLKEIYSDMKSRGFNIVGISSDRTRQSWLKALDDDKMPWNNFIQDNQSNIIKLFDIQSIPSYLLVDDKGKLLAFFSGSAGVKNFGGKLHPEGLEETLSAYLK